MATKYKDYYETLGVPRSATQDDIKQAYRKLARKYHPDVSPGPEAAARMIAINAAWEQIGDPVKRAAFDRERAVQAAMARRYGLPSTQRRPSPISVPPSRPP